MFDHVRIAPTLSDQVTNALLARIESGQLKSGEKLPPEVVLAPEFGVSRTVIREAISRLKHEGLVESRQGSGVFVRAQASMSPLKIEDSVVESRESVLQIVELRRAIELKPPQWPLSVAPRRSLREWKPRFVPLMRMYLRGAMVWPQTLSFTV